MIQHDQTSQGLTIYYGEGTTLWLFCVLYNLHFTHTHLHTHTHTRWLQVANKLLELHIQLKDLGHPKYVKPVETRILECKTHLDKADGEVHMFMYVVFVSTYTYASLPMVHMYSSLGFPHSQKHTDNTFHPHRLQILSHC